LSNSPDKNSQPTSSIDSGPQDAADMPAPGIGNPESWLSVLLGVCLPIILLFVQLPLYSLESPAIAFIGLIQLLYVVPAVVYCRSKGRFKFAKGLIIGACTVFLLNTACFGFIFLLSR
jgi:hypothetical protein